MSFENKFRHQNLNLSSKNDSLHKKIEEQDQLIKNQNEDIF